MEPGGKGHLNTRVLIVEDDALQADSLEAVLVQRGLEVCGKVRSAAGALYLARTKRPEVILIDVRLAGTRDGIHAAEMIRREQECRLIYLTAHTDSRTKERMERTQPVAILAKPATADEIIAAVERVIGSP